MITKTERQELRQIVRQQFKVLRSELAQREAELEGEAEKRIADRYMERDEKREALMWKAHEICEAAAREITDLLLGSGAKHDAGYGRADDPDVSVEQPVTVRLSSIRWHDADKVQNRRALTSALKADVAGAMLRLDRQEADLLRTLSVGALESEAAHAFLTAIPTVGELVSSARLAELEAQFAGEDSA